MYNIDKKIAVIETKGLLNEVNRLISDVEFNLAEDNFDKLIGKLEDVEMIINAIKKKVDSHKPIYDEDEDTFGI